MKHPGIETASKITERLRRKGHRAYIAGGAVRDHLLGIPPADVDVATSAHPEEVLTLFPGSRYVGAAFGVVLVVVDEEPIEVATFRTEGPYLDGRRPSSVQFATEEEDVRRRDFTVNGLLLDPSTGEVHDFVGGQLDLKARRLRAIGDPRARFEEDHLRLLRAVRLAAQLDFEIEETTLAALKALAPLAAQVASERIREELVTLLTGPAPSCGLALLRDTGLLGVVLPEVEAMRGVEQPNEFHPEGDVLTHTFLLFDHLAKPSSALAFGALLHDVGKPATFERGVDRIRFLNHASVGAKMTDDICRRLRFSNEERERIVALVENHMRFRDVRNMRDATLKRFLRLPHFDEHLALHRADCLASHGLLENWEYANRRREEFGEDALRPPRLVTGDDLLKLGYSEGPELGSELRRLEELQLDGQLRTREDALARAEEDLRS